MTRFDTIKIEKGTQNIVEQEPKEKALVELQEHLQNFIVPAKLIIETALRQRSPRTAEASDILTRLELQWRVLENLHTISGFLESPIRKKLFLETLAKLPELLEFFQSLPSSIVERSKLSELRALSDELKNPFEEKIAQAQQEIVPAMPETEHIITTDKKLLAWQKSFESFADKYLLALETLKSALEAWQDRLLVLPEEQKAVTEYKRKIEQELSNITALGIQYDVSKNATDTAEFLKDPLRKLSLTDAIKRFQELTSFLNEINQWLTVHNALENPLIQASAIDELETLHQQLASIIQDNS